MDMSEDCKILVKWGKCRMGGKPKQYQNSQPLRLGVFDD
jgi:hypothetical protein